MIQLQGPEENRHTLVIPDPLHNFLGSLIILGMAVFRCKHPIPDTCPPSAYKLFEGELCPECRISEGANEALKPVYVQVPPSIWAKFRAEATLQGMPVYRLLTEVLKDYINARGE